MQEYHFILKLPDENDLKKFIRFFAGIKLEIFLLLITAALSFIWNLNFKINVLVLFSFLILIIIEKQGNILLRGLMALGRDILSQKLSSLLLIIILSLLLVWSIDRELIIFLMIFLTWLLYGWQSRVIVFATFALLAVCPFLLTFKKYAAINEQIAVYGYYFLIITLVLQAVESYKDNKSKDLNNF